MASPHSLLDDALSTLVPIVGLNCLVPTILGPRYAWHLPLSLAQIEQLGFSGFDRNGDGATAAARAVTARDAHGREITLPAPPAALTAVSHAFVHVDQQHLRSHC